MEEIMNRNESSVEISRNSKGDLTLQEVKPLLKQIERTMKRTELVDVE